MFIKEAWFWRGFQSAIFYYISCAPCTKVLDQRRKKQKAARAKAEKAARKAAQAQLVKEGNALEPEYDHPLPSSTNPFWEEEMELGPGPPPKRRTRQGAGEGPARERERERESKEKARKKSESMEMVQTTAMIATKTGSGPGTSSGITNKNLLMNASTNTVGGKLTSATPSNAGEAPQDLPDTDWNRKRYQREDELLWGLDGHDHQPLKTTGPSTSLSRNSSSGHRKQRDYYYARNPAVNDLHPPVVSTAPRSRLETQWMLQPPPRAKFMAGTERANRERSETTSSRSSRANSRRTRPNGGRAGDSKTRRSGNASNTKDQLLGVDSIGMSRSRGSSAQSRASSKPLSRTPSAQHGDRVASSSNSLRSGRSPSQPQPPPSIAIEAIPNVVLPPSPSLQVARPSLQTIVSASLVQASKDEKENTVVDPSLQPSTIDGTSLFTASSNILQPVSNQMNRASSVNSPFRSSEAVGTKNPGKGEGVGKDERWRFPGAEDGWVFPVVIGASRRGLGAGAGDGDGEVGPEMGMGMGMVTGAGMGPHQQRQQQRWSMDI